MIDEAHNLSANWFKALASVPSSSLGLTIFWDANQLWSPSLKPGHHKGFNEKILDLQDALQSSLGCTPIELSVNYRNSREIADFFSAELSRALPQSIPLSSISIQCRACSGHPLRAASRSFLPGGCGCCHRTEDIRAVRDCGRGSERKALKNPAC